MAKNIKRGITPDRKEIAEKQIVEQSRIIKYDTVNYAIDYLVEQFNPSKESDAAEDGAAARLFIIPDYQRNSVWDDSDRSAFIESLLLGLPIPFLFFCERKDGIIEIVDGVQRVTALNSFINNNFALKGLTKLSELNGFTFSDFSETTQRKFRNKTLRITLLDGDTSVEFRKDLFSRVNKSGRKINDAEFRRGTFPGKLTQFIERCSKDPLFVELCPLNNKKVERYARFELALRFFAFVNAYQDFKHEAAPFLDSFLELNQNSFNEVEYKNEFTAMCTFVKEHFPLGFVCGRQSVSNVRFEALSVGVALALREIPNLPVDNTDWLNSDEFKELTASVSSNNPGRLAARIEYVRDCLLGRHNERND
ncbi:MAG: DUF262 domain-containing protein [Peptococcaceae bacterium]|jgi:hypothetical protein|nr:DUF262 domain-containing protein [Peptococcaceae bacterium]